MMSWLILLSCIGLTWILKYATILNFIRKPICSIHPKIDDLFKCAMCLGFWVGAIHAVLLHHLGADLPVFVWVLYPFSSSALCWFFDCLIDYIQMQQIRLERELDLKKH